MSTNKLAASCHITARLYIINIQTFSNRPRQIHSYFFLTVTLQHLPAKRPSRIKNISSHLYHSRVTITVENHYNITALSMRAATTQFPF